MPRPLCSTDSTGYPMNREARGLSSRLDVLNKGSFAPDGVRTPNRPARSLVAIPTARIL